jgi:hypothetical protein
MLGDAPLGLDRARRLADRVRWLDRHRRQLAIVVAATLAIVLVTLINDLLDGDWPETHATVVAALFGFVAWWVLEIALVWLTAVWETDSARLIRDRGMPPARVHVRK